MTTAKLSGALATAEPIERMTRDEWLAKRRTGIGGTHAAAICGLNKFQTPFQAYVDLVEGSDDAEESELLYWGQALEGPILNRLSRDLNMQTIRGLFCRHPEREWHCGSIDAVLLDPSGNPAAGADAKNTNFFMKDDWGTADAPVVPQGYEGQGRWYMPLIGVTVWWFPVLIGGHQFRKVAAYHDQATFDDMLTIVDDFRRKHLIPRVPPAIDGTDTARDHLRKRFANSTEILRDPTDQEEGFISRLLYAVQGAKRAERELATATNLVIEAIGPDKGIKYGGKKVSAVRGKSAPFTNWKLVAEELKASAELIEKHTKPGTEFVYLSTPRAWSKGE